MTISWKCFFALLALTGFSQVKPDNAYANSDAATAAPSAVVPATQPPTEEAPIFSCDFENDFCGFTPVADLGKEWHRMNIHDTEGIMAPIVPTRPDHLNSDRFLFAELTNKAIYTVAAQLVSPRVPRLAQRADFCLKFSMFFEAPDMTKLKINIHRWPGNVQTLLREIISTPDVGWVNVETDFRFLLEFQISLRVEILPRTLQEADIAIDDLVLLPGKCRKAVDPVPTMSLNRTCDFEEDDCGFVSNGEEGIAKWVRWSRATMTSGSDLDVVALTPSVDSTYHSFEGHYAFILFGPKTNQSENQVIVSYDSNLMDFSGPRCITFFYRNHALNSKPQLIFAVSAFNGDQESGALFVSSTDEGSRWIAVKTTLKKSDLDAPQFRLRFAVEAPPRARASVAIDDITITDGDCSHPGDCAFEINDKMCSWQHVTDLEMKWVNERAKPDVPFKGNDYMHFTGGRSTGHEAGSTAVIYSQDLSNVNPKPKCLTFNFFMNSTGAAVVRVHGVPRLLANNVLWEHHGHPEVVAGIQVRPGWALAKVPFSSPLVWNPDTGEHPDTVDFSMIKFEGVILREVDEWYIMAIDDIQFLDQDCQLEPKSAEPIPAVPPPRPPVDNLCTFDDFATEGNMCGWGLSDTPITWTMTTGEQRPTDSSMPYIDHTHMENYGYFLYFAASKYENSLGKVARVTTRSFERDKAEEEQCLRFWYYLGGVNGGNLNVRVDDNGSGQQDVVISTVKSGSTKMWMLSSTAVPTGMLDYKITFEAVITSNSPRGGIALDDISVVDGPCRQVDCDFEQGMCDWQDYYSHNVSSGEVVKDELDFDFATKDILPNLVPNDHGYFLHVLLRSSMPAFQEAFLSLAGFVPRSTNYYCVAFDFALSDRTAASLTLSYYYLEKETGFDYEPVWSTSSPAVKLDPNTWTAGQVLLDKSFDWTLMFGVMNNPGGLPEGVLGYDDNTIALDNIRHRVVSTREECPTLPLGADNAAPAVQLNCNFNADGWCGWFNNNLAPKAFERVNQNYASDVDRPYPVPIHDPNAQDNFFLMVDLANPSTGETNAELFSPNVQSQSSLDGVYCFKFWAYMHSDDMSRLDVVLHSRPSGQTLNLRSITADTDEVWNLYHIDFVTLSAFQLAMFVHIPRRALEGGVLALDTVTLESGVCYKDLEIVNTTVGKVCDFEENECGFINAGDTDSVSWVRTSREKMPGGDLEILQLTPDVDATYHSMEGHYIFAHFGPKMDDAREEKSATYNSNPMNFNGTHCISFYYRMEFNRQKPTVKFYLKYLSDILPPSTRYVATASHGKKWVSVKTEISKQNGVTLSFEAIGPPKSRAGVAIDDIHIDQGSCSHAGDCNFNSNDRLCSWQHLRTIGSMRWLNRVAPIAAPNPPTPTYSISFEGGRSTGNEVNSRAVLYSEAFPMPQEEDEQLDACMTFHYFMNASGAAVVRIHQVFDPEEENPIWENYGRASPFASASENTWRLAKVPLRQMMSLETEYLITIEGLILRETDKKYIMAIDDVQFVASYCTWEPADSKPLPVVTPPLDTPEAMCTFEFSPIQAPFCGFNLSSNGGENPWTVLTGATTNGDKFAPRYDHTKKEDYARFMYFNATANGRPGNRAVALSTAYTRDKPDQMRCLRFWRFFGGEHDENGEMTQEIGSLGVYAKTSAADPVRLLTMNAEWTMYWELSTVIIPEGIMSYQLMFIAETAGEWPTGGMAIDDISISEDNCRLIDCDFERGACHYENFLDASGLDDLDWVFGTSENLPVLNNDTDHGFFMFVPLQASIPPNHMGWLRHKDTVDKVAGGRNYCLDFDFAITDLNVGQLAVQLYWIDAKNTWHYKSIWQTMGGPMADGGNVTVGKWQPGQVFISIQESWTIMFEVTSHPFGVAVPSDAYQTNGIAIDNVQYTIVKSESECPLRPARPVIPTQPSPSTAVPTKPPTAPPTTIGPVSGIDCDFGAGDTCGWVTRPTDPYKFKLGKAGATGAVAGPVSGDFAPGRDGYFAYIDAPAGTPNQVARLYSPYVKRTSDYCIRFFYNANGLSVGAINLYYVKKGDADPASPPTFTAPLSVAGRGFGDQWIGASYKATGVTVEKMFMLEAVRGATPTSYLALDNLQMLDRACENPGYCNFDKDFCNYNPAFDFRSPWHLNGTGTTKQARAERLDGHAEVFVMRSEVIPPKTNACLRFSYNLRTAPTSISYLAFYTIQYPKTEDPKPVRTLLWILNRRTATGQYLDGTVPVNTANSFQISVEANFVAGQSAEDISLENILLTVVGPACPLSPPEANPSPPPTTSPRPFTVVTIPAETTPSPENPSPLASYNCNFGTKPKFYCDWSMKSNAASTITWATDNGEMHTDSGPAADVSGNGYYAYLQTRSPTGPTFGRMESPKIVFPASAGEQPSYYLVSFYYMMHGNGVDKLQFSARNDSEPTYLDRHELWSTRGAQGRMWKVANVVIANPNMAIRVAFTGHRLQGNPRGYIAVDEIKFEAGKLPDQFDEHVCDFETPSICGYDQSSTVPASVWNQRNGQHSIINNNTGPQFDKSQNAPGGYFMSFDAKGLNRGNQGDLFSNVHPPTTEACIKFYYYKRTRDFPGALTVRLDKNDQLTMDIWTDNSNSVLAGDFWQPMFVDINSPEDAWRVHFVARVLDPTQSIIAIDHVILRNGSCDSNVLDCDFDEKDMCDWSNDLQTDHAQWEWWSGLSQIPETGPQADQGGTEEGGYLIMEAVSLANGDVSRVLSSPVSGAYGDSCLTFWFHMYGKDMGELTVFERDIGTGQENAIWQLRGEQGNSWIRGRISLDSASPFRVVIEARRTQDGVRGTIGIDSISNDFDSQNCQRLPAGAVVVPTTPSPATTVGSTRPPGFFELDCDFEHGSFCDWNIVGLADFTWKPMKAITAFSSVGGPFLDHTTHNANGGYLIAASAEDNDYEGRVTRLDSREINDGKLRCLSFYYHAVGAGLGVIRIRKTTRSFPGGTIISQSILWSRHSPDEGSVWQLGQVNVKNDTGFTTISIEAVAGTGKGNIALDDITEKFGICHNDDTFCDFENGRCNFQDSPDQNVMAFHVVTPSDGMQVLGTPDVDVSLGTKEGHFFMAHRVADATADKAYTRTPNYPDFNQTRCFQFFYNIELSNVSDPLPWLTVNHVDPSFDRRTEKLRTTGQFRSYDWRIFNFEIAPLPGSASGNGFYVEFIGDMVIRTGISIDDVSVNVGECKHLWDCDFSDGSTCNWYQPKDHSRTDDFDWLILSPRIALEVHQLPSIDHTTNSEEGWMAVANSRLSESARLQSPDLPPNHYYCMSFWYFFSPPQPEQKRPSTLKAFGVYEDHEGQERQTPYWQLDEHETTPQWSHGQFGQSRQWLQSLVIEANMGGHPYLYIALDDIKVTGANCDLLPATADPTYKPPTVPPPLAEDFEFVCNFDDSTLCKFENVPHEPIPGVTVDTCNWSVRKGPAINTQSGPRTDHTLQNTAGGYLYFQTDTCHWPLVPLMVSARTVKSVAANATLPAQCFSFWYHMYGAPGALLLSIAFDNNDRRIEWARRNNQGDRWIQAHVTIDNIDKIGYKILFNALPGRSRFGDIALDDIHLRDGECREQRGVCDFESKNLCSFMAVQMSGTEMLWSSTQAVLMQPPPAGFDGYDHTLMTPEGYVAVTSGEGRPKGERTFMVSTLQAGATVAAVYIDQCVTFWYRVADRTGEGKLSVYVNMEGQQYDFQREAWSMTGPTIGTAWEYGTVAGLTEKYTFAFGATNGVDSYFALDDIRVIDGRCPTPLTCDFENGMCGWDNEESMDDFNWIIVKGDTSLSDSAGPSVDHTTNTANGHYVYIDNDYPNDVQDEPDTAHLTSQRVTSAVNQWCFSFWYHMYIDSKSKASLNLFMVRAFGAEDQLWGINGPQRNIWTQARLSIDEAPVNGFRLSFRGKVQGAKGKSDIALDDFHAENKLCEDIDQPPFDCPNGLQIDQTLVCDQKKDCADGRDEHNCGACKFDTDDLCDYKIFSNDAFTWMQSSPMTRGADSDGNEDGSKFLRADFIRGELRSSTFLDSPWLHETAATCQVSFWYQISSNNLTDSGALIVYLQLEDTLTTTAILDGVHPAALSTNKWHQYFADVGRRSGEFRLIFRARKGMTHSGHISLDNIKMTGCDFHAPTPDPEQCPAGDFKCAETKICVENDMKCDFTDDCGKREDETLCDITAPMRCDFESGLCDWSHGNGNQVNWRHTKGRTTTPNSGPLRDHTTGLANGGFAYLKSSPVVNEFGDLLSPVLAPHRPEDNCRLRYYVHMFGSTMGTLVVGAWTNSDPPLEELNNMNGDYGDTWHRKSIPLSGTVPFQVVFRGIIGGISSDIAIDDVSFNENCRLYNGSIIQPTVPMQTDPVTKPTPTVPTTQPTVPTTQPPIPTTQPTIPTTRPTAPIQTAPTSNPTVPSHSDSTIPPAHSTLDTIKDHPLAPKGRIGAGPIAGIVVGCIAAMAVMAGVLMFVVRRRRKFGEANAGASWVTSGYKNFGTLDGATTDDTDDTDGNNNVFNDLYSGDL
ncbi:MAM and LDL-receptor class A domain-containing protein 2 [Hypsibius exemplaris]|uniref:MAM and LDL-receptor class A domain-containing protein 2 n=1 Tax=Hypsibius exemplaris TaxID=2072580 RepID=A0A9X6RLI5_HYPEX|nr:MAM and LDL-receptor class A domain-containing protein 2 [Hypsibius exemplaris]